MKPRISCDGLQRHVQLRAVADAVELDPVGVREHRAVALGGARPRRGCGPRCPRRSAPDTRPARGRAASRGRGRARPARACPAQRAAPRIWCASSSGGMCSQRSAMNSAARRRPSGVATIASACGARARSAARASRRSGRASPGRRRRPPPSRRPARARRPSARGRARRAAARGSRRASCRRRARSSNPASSIARSTASTTASSGGAARERRPAGVARQRRREHVVPALERGQHQLPRAPRVGEAVQQHERLARAAAVRRGEARVHDGAG